MKKKIILLPLSALLLSTLSGCDFMKNGNLLDLLDPLQIFHKKDDKEKDNKDDDDIDDGEDHNTSPHISSITIFTEEEAGATCFINKTCQLQADVKVIGDLSTEVTWTSENETIATVDSTGLVTGKSEGTVKIIATSNVDQTVKGEVSFIVMTANVNKVNANNSPTTPYFMTLNDEPKIFGVSVSAPNGASVSDIPAERKTFTWSVDKQNIIDFKVVEDSKNPTMKVEVTPKAIGNVKLTATNNYENTLYRDFYIKVISVDEGDYFWQFNENDRAKFGYTSDDRKGNESGVATLADLDWEYTRNPAISIGTSVGNTLTFGSASDISERKAENVTFTNKNTKTVSRIIVDTASAHSLADFTITIGGKEVINTKAPALTYENDCNPIDSGVLEEPLKGDIVLHWENPEFDPAIHSGEGSYSKGPGGINLKAIRIFYEESHIPHIESVKIEGKTEVFINKTLELTAIVKKIGDLAETVTWSSDNEAIATVDQTGKVTGVAAGKVKIFATSTVDDTVKGELEIEVKIPWIKSVSPSLKAPYYFVLGSAAKKVTLTPNAPTGANATDIPAEQKLFTWSIDKEGIISFTDASEKGKPTLAVNVTALAVGEAVLTATNTYDPSIKTDIYFKVINVNQGDYLWQYESSFRAQFGYKTQEATAGTKEGDAILGDITWHYERNRVVSLNTTLSGAIGFGKKATAKEPQNSESITLTSVNTKKVSRIIVDTASTNGLATLDIKVGEVSLINGPQKVEAALENNDCLSIDTGVLTNAVEGDIVLEWQNPDFDPAIHIVDKVEKGPGSVFIKAIQVMYAE